MKNNKSATRGLSLEKSVLARARAQLLNMLYNSTPFAVHYEKIRIHLCELTTNSAKMHS